MNSPIYWSLLTEHQQNQILNSLTPILSITISKYYFKVSLIADQLFEFLQPFQQTEINRSNFYKNYNALAHAKIRFATQITDDTLVFFQLANTQSF